MKNFFFYLIIFLIGSSCNRLTPVERDIKDNLGKTLQLTISDTIQHGDTRLPFEEFRKRFKYISVVYLEDGCRPCYSKFIEWQKKSIPFSTSENYSVLFVIQGFTYKQFMTRVNDIDSSIKDQYYTIMDMNYKYLHINKSIPKWIIDSSMLVDQDNKIKMIGMPWKTDEMTNLFKQICQQ